MTTDLPAIAPRPRSMPLRLAFTVLIVLVFLTLSWLATWAVQRTGGGAAGGTSLSLLVTFVLGALMAVRVSYRWFDAFLLLVPILGLFLLVKWAWRVAFLPYRDWPPRAPEAPRWRLVAHPRRSGAGVYLVDPAARG
jgi:hypothetical protein